VFALAQQLFLVRQVSTLESSGSHTFSGLANRLVKVTETETETVCSRSVKRQLSTSSPFSYTGERGAQGIILNTEREGKLEEEKRGEEKNEEEEEQHKK
jgi:hypothetical protein